MQTKSQCNEIKAQQYNSTTVENRHMNKKLRFAIFGNEYQTKKSTAAQKLLSLLAEKKAEVYMDRAFHEFLTKGQQIDINVNDVFDGTLKELRENMGATIDFVISMGGDGTFLKAASRVGSEGTPIMGINMGRLGYLADVTPTEIDKAIAMLYDGHYSLQGHSVIEVLAEDRSHTSNSPSMVRLHGTPTAINDIAVLKQDSASMISIHTRINDEALVTYQADGLIVSTPTGSTAYSLSNGGPIIVPDTDVLCLTPVAPHSLNVRPIVVSAESVITIDVESRSQKYLVAIDGRSEKLHESTRLTIRRAPYTVRIVKRQRHNYFSTLREKMMWGMDNRG